MIPDVALQLAPNAREHNVSNSTPSTITSSHLITNVTRLNIDELAYIHSHPLTHHSHEMSILKLTTEPSLTYQELYCIYTPLTP